MISNEDTGNRTLVSDMLAMQGLLTRQKNCKKSNFHVLAVSMQGSIVGNMLGQYPTLGIENIY